MRVAAAQYAQGNYEYRANIHRRDEIGELAEALDNLSDKLTQSEAARKSLEQSRMDFFANVSHELRTPITVIRGYTEALYDGIVTGEEKTHRYYERMLKECRSMERLVGDLLTLSKMQNPQFVLEVEPVNLIQIFEDLMRSAAVIAKKKNISIDFVKNRSYIMMPGDYDRLRQMFLVILDNAIKFSPENSTVHLTVAEKEEAIVVTIRDEGIGISEEELPNIFDKFYKSKLRQNAAGSGLGLMIAKEIATRHNGVIEVSSVVNLGTAFVFTFSKNWDATKLEEMEES
jgi:signal transduction histidine kinase